jgi:hypothetical protein
VCRKSSLLSLHSSIKKPICLSVRIRFLIVFRIIESIYKINETVITWPYHLATMKLSFISDVNFSGLSKISILILVCSMILVLILNSNFQMGLLKDNLLSSNNKITIFSLYVLIFISTSTILMNLTNNIKKREIEGNRKEQISYASILVIHLVLSATLIITTVQMFLFNKYSDLVFYFTCYLSFVSSLAFLSILSIKFFHLFLLRRDFLTLLYVILFAIYCFILILLLL